MSKRRGLDARAFVFVEHIQDLATPEAVIEAFQAEAAGFGFTTMALGELPRYGSAELPSFFFSTWPPDWGELYVAEGLVRDDPSVLHGRIGTWPASWSELRKRHRRPGQRRVFDIVTGHGWPEGFCVPVAGPGTYRGVVTIGSEAPEISPRDRTALHLMALYLHQRLFEMIEPERAQRSGDLPELSPGEIECIKWLVLGKSDWEIGEILKIAESTAHWRIERAKRKFGVKTRAQLTALAVHHGIVSP